MSIDRILDKKEEKDSSMALQIKMNERSEKSEGEGNHLHSVSMVMPFLNEVEYIQMTVTKAQNVLDTIGVDYEIVLVNDASSDGSEKIAVKLSEAEPRIKLFHHEKNRGLGAALKTGFNNASKDIIIYTDVDMPFDFSILAKTLELLGNADIIHGYRIGKRESFLRVLYSLIYNFVIRILFHYEANDINFAMTIFKRKVLKDICLHANGSFFSAEFLLKSYYKGYKIIDVPVNFIHRKYGRSRLASANNIFRILYEMMRYYPEIKSLRCRANRQSIKI